MTHVRILSYIKEEGFTYVYFGGKEDELQEKLCA